MISMYVNGREYETDVAPETPLLWVLRDILGFTGVKYGCGEGTCGACTVLVDGVAERSCTISVQSVAGSRITTIEGVPADHPVKKAWIEHQVPQCGYCQPGMMLQAIDVLSSGTRSEKEMVESLDDVVCRCGSHPRAIAALKQAAGTKKK